MNLLHVVKKFVIPDDGDVSVGVVAVLAEVGPVGPGVPGAGREIAVPPVLVPRVDGVAHALLAVLADADSASLLANKGRIHRVDSSRIVLVHEREAGVV